MVYKIFFSFFKFLKTLRIRPVIIMCSTVVTCNCDSVILTINIDLGVAD